MNTLRRIALLALVAVCCWSCIRIETKVIVNRDGSGKVIKTMMMSESMLQLVTMMSSMFPDSSDTGEQGFKVFDEQDLISKAGEMGKGVRYVQGEEIAMEGYSGFRAIYSFSDINQLQLSEDSSGDLPAPPGTMGMDAEEAPVEKTYTTFRFTRGAGSELTVMMPRDRQDDMAGTDEVASDSETGSGEEVNEADLRKVKAMFDNARIAMLIEINGQIDQTNATHHEGSQVTLVDMDFGKLMSDPNKLMQLRNMESKSFHEAKDILGDIPGIKFEPEEVVSIRFH